jgi:PRTRC genetic system ThiF family protein
MCARYPEHFHKDSLRTSSASPHLIIGCVDTRAARQDIQSAVTRANDSTVYWLDLGNNASSGQYVLGQPLNAANRRGATRLRTVAELYPEIADAEGGEDPLPSCSAAEALERQEPFINQVLATSALAMLARLFRYGILTHHGAFYNAATGRMAALPVDSRMWERLRRRNRHAQSRVEKRSR